MFQSFKRFTGSWLAVLLVAIAPQAFAQATYYTNSDNENNAGTHVADNDMDVSLGNANLIHPIEFNIDVATPPQSSVVLSMRSLDVDEEDGEVDLVYLNGSPSGIGGGVVVAGDVYRGTSSNSVEIGHITIDAINGGECSCGNRGCLENYAGPSAVILARSLSWKPSET